MSRVYSRNDNPILSIEEQASIVDWVRTHYKYFRPNGANRFMQQLDCFDNLPACVWAIKQRIFDKEQLHEYPQEPLFRDSVGYMLHGASLHRHTDPNPDDGSGLIHTRFNVYVQLPHKGGYPIYNNIHCTLEERTYICCRSGLDFHSCAPVEGERERIVLSFGVLVPPERIQDIVYDYDSP